MEAKRDGLNEQLNSFQKLDLTINNSSNSQQQDSKEMNADNDTSSNDSNNNLDNSNGPGSASTLKKDFNFEKRPRCNGTYEDYPEWNRDNEYIQTGYRVHQKGTRQVLWTMFQIHNETVNVWSHFLAYLFYTAIIVFILVHFPNMYKQGHLGLQEYTQHNKSSQGSTLDLYSSKVFAQMSQQLKEAEDNFINHFELTQINMTQDGKISKFSREFSNGIEKMAFLLVDNIQSTYLNIFEEQKNHQPQNSTSSKNAVSLILQLNDKMSAFKDFIGRYQYISKDEINLSEEKNRMNVIELGIKQVEKAFKDIDQKISIWISNDPMYKADPDLFDPVLILTYVPRWPLIIFAVSACICLGSSAFFHLFQIHSIPLRDFLARLDYGGICLLIMGSSYPPIFYPFACEEVFFVRNGFLVLITITCTASFVACMMPAFAKAEYRTIRAYLFIVLGISAVSPFIYLYHFADKRYIDTTASVVPWAVGGASYILGALNYAFRMPERFCPGKFDCFGSSHQIFHIAVIAGCSIHFNASMNLFLERKQIVCPIQSPF